MIYDILFAVCGVGLIALGLSLVKLSFKVDSWIKLIVKHEKTFNDIEWHRVDDLSKLAALQQRVNILEKRLEAQAAELTEHHNKIDTLEIHGGIYEGLFEQQGLWGEDSEVPKFSDPEDEEIII